MFTLRHRNADLLRFDWLPDRGGRQEVPIERILPAARRFLRRKAAELARG